MIIRRVTLVFAALIYACAIAFSQVPSDAEIRKILADRIGFENAGLGIVVGVIDTNGRRVVSYGSLREGNSGRVGGDTVFEIGSMTKVFTSLVLMDMARRGEVAITDPVSKYLPAAVKMPERNGRKITLADLSTHSSGLPRMPTNFAPKDASNPYVDYTVQQLYDFLSGYTLERDIGAEYEYSNLGAGLLGHVLSLRAGMSYEALVRARICDLLGMADTRMTLTPEMKARLAVGHNGALTPVPNWDIPTLAGAGAFRSTANDMLTFLAANLGFLETSLSPAMADAISVRHPGENPDTKMAYGWEVGTKYGNPIIWKGGATGGYRTYMGYDPKARVGVVVLSNVLQPVVDEIGPHLLNPSYPLSKMGPLAHPEITLDTKVFDRYVGTYQFDTKELIVISREEGHFYAQLTGQRKLEVFAETARTFFYKAVDAELTFDVGGQEAATQVTLHQNGRDHIAKRLSGAN
jgi:D-alanyl-D-alanine-carboxypeptidase/D-alanyl-D-alanine-endopeptidase